VSDKPRQEQKDAFIENPSKPHDCTDGRIVVTWQGDRSDGDRGYPEGLRVGLEEETDALGSAS